MVGHPVAVAVLAWDPTQTHAECDWRRHCLTRKAHAGAVGVGIGPVAEATVESQEPASTVQQEPAFSSSYIAPPMPTQNTQDEPMDLPME